MNAALEKRIKRQVIGKPHRFLAVTPLGFEQTLIDELEYIKQEISNRAHQEPKAIESSATQPAEQPHIVGDGKVEFTAKLTEAWKAVAYSRVANRVLMEIGNFKAENFRDFEKKAGEIPWELYLDERTGYALQTKDERYLGNVILSEAHRTKSKNPVNFCSPSLNIHVTCKHSRLYHSDAIAERLQKIIEGGSLPLTPSRRENGPSVQQAKDEKESTKTSFRLSSTSEAPSRLDYATPTAGTPRNAPQQNIYVHFLDDRCTIWQDLAGEELYKRGHKRFVNEAPLKETIAAAMIFEAFHMAKPQKDDTSEKIQDDIIAKPQSEHSERPHTSHLTVLIDPMSGSGTFSLEAAYIANKLIPGVCREFALKHQPAFKEASWKHLIKQENLNGALAQAHNSIGSVMPVSKQPVATLASHVIPDVAPQGAKAKNLEIVTSDISERAVSIIKHNIESSPLADIAPNAIHPKIRDFFSYTAEEIASTSKNESSPILVLNPPYGKRLDFDAPRLYTKIGRKLKNLAHDLNALGIPLTVAILAPKDDTRNGTKYTCTANLLCECPRLSPEHNSTAKLIVTSHGGFSLNVFIAKI